MRLSAVERESGFFCRKVTIMLKDFNEVEKYVLKSGITKRIALAGSHDDAALAALIDAMHKGVVSGGVLVGDEARTRKLLAAMDESPDNFGFIDEATETKAARIALKQISEGNADIPMKGLVQTQSFLMAIANPLLGMMPKDGILSHAMIFYFTDRAQLLFVTDCALTVSPTLEEKVKLVHNIAKTAQAFGYDPVKVAALSAVEKVNPVIQSTGDADALENMDWGDSIIVQGPFALDNALDLEAAEHKGIHKEVAGRADVLLMPDLCAGNIFYKSVHYLGHMPTAGVLIGANSPVILSSRSDPPDTKYHSILSAVLLSK
jgi:phosphate butyryltransferase